MATVLRNMFTVTRSWSRKLKAKCKIRHVAQQSTSTRWLHIMFVTSCTRAAIYGPVTTQTVSYHLVVNFQYFYPSILTINTRLPVTAGSGGRWCSLDARNLITRKECTRNADWICNPSSDITSRSSKAYIENRCIQLLLKSHTGQKKTSERYSVLRHGSWKNNDEGPNQQEYWLQHRLVYCRLVGTT